MVLHFTAASRDSITRTVRVVDDAASVPLAVSAPAGPVDVTAYAFGQGAAALSPGLPLALDPVTLQWKSDGTSTYAEETGALLTGAPGAWLFETAGITRFEASAVPARTPVPSLLTTYFDRAARYGDAAGQPGACVEQVAAMDASETAVGTACAWRPARVGESACTQGTGGTGIDPTASTAAASTTSDLAFSGAHAGVRVAHAGP